MHASLRINSRAMIRAALEAQRGQTQYMLGKHC